MNSMERMVKCLHHEEADRVPVSPILGGCVRHLVGASYKEWSTNADVCAEGFIKARELTGCDCIVTLIDLSVECTAWGQELEFEEKNAAHPNYKNQVIKTEEDYEKIQKVDYRTCERMMMHIDVCKKLVEDSKGEYPVIAFVFGPLGTLSMLRNQEQMYMDCIEEPEMVKEAAARINETLMEYAEALLDTGIQGIMIDTLFASGSIMRKEMWDDLEGELVEKFAQRVKAKNGLFMIHNCGDKIYFDVQIQRMHPDAISFLYPPADCKDFAECKEKYGKQTTLIGCVQPTSVTYASDEEFEAECKKNMEIMAAGGGYVLATGCEYPSDTPLDRAVKMRELAETFGAYGK